MAITKILFINATDSTNPDPNTLTGNPLTPQGEISQSYLDTNGVDLFIVNDIIKIDRNQNRTSGFAFVPSVDTATYTISLWVYLRPFGIWVKPKNIPAVSYTGYDSMDYMVLEGLYGELCYFSIDSLSSGVLSCSVDGTALQVSNQTL